MKSRGNKIIFGSAMGLAAIAVAIDHTRHQLPEPAPAVSRGQATGADAGTTTIGTVSESPCGIGGSGSPCGLGGSPCGLGGSPCGLGGSPCGLGGGGSPCSLE